MPEHGQTGRQRWRRRHERFAGKRCDSHQRITGLVCIRARGGCAASPRGWEQLKSSKIEPRNTLKDAKKGYASRPICRGGCSPVDSPAVSVVSFPRLSSAMRGSEKKAIAHETH